MALYIQHGHGKSERITAALRDRSVDGVIFAARNERPENLKAYISELRAERSCEVLFDPQFYVSTLVPPNDGYLPEFYPYYSTGRTARDFISAARIAEYAQHTLDCQLDLGVDRLISPTVIFNAFNDRWYQVALTLADASLAYHGTLDQPPPLLLSVVFSESALDSRGDLDNFLDTVTQWDMDGIYLIVVREGNGYSQRFDDSRLAHLLYLVYALGDRNGFRVICGYTDFAGPVLRAAGAAGFATGWYQSLRQFRLESFLRRKGGGRPPRLRYSSRPLFNSILLSELHSIYEIGELDEALSGVSLDSIITSARSPESADWTQTVSERHHWQTLQAMDAALAGQVRSDITHVLKWLEEARGLYKVLGTAGVVFERATDSDHLDEWTSAVRTFQAIARP